MTTELIDTKQLEIHAEAINNAMELAERGAAMAVTGAITAGTEMIKAKAIVPHGEWAAWIGTNLNYSQAKVNRYMRIASNSSCVTNLKDAKSISEALRILADDKAEKDPDPPIVPRSERKPADVKVSIPDDSTRVLDDEGEPDADEVDDDPTPDPPTNRKTAKGSAKVPEAKKPKTAAIVPEIVDDDKPNDSVEAFDRAGRIIDAFVIQCDVERFIDMKSKAGLIGDGKKAAKQLRKLADKLDPPTKFRRPESDDVLSMLRTYAATEEFVSKHGKRSDMELAIATAEFMDHYDGNGWLIGKAAMKDWQATARKWLRNQPQFSNGKAQNNGHSNGRTDGSCLGANGRPEVQKRKIIYK